MISDENSVPRDDTDALRQPQNTLHKLHTHIERALRVLSPFEAFVFGILVFLLISSTAVIIAEVRIRVMAEVPSQGGSFREGVIGIPRFINPLLALTDADRDMTELVYTGLLRVSSDGELVPDLAERYSISEDGTEYTFILRDSARFHDGTPVTADDVVFTVTMAQDATLKSPKRADWEGVTVQKVNDREIHFILEQPYAPFLENTTMGILPRHIWQSVSPQEFSFSIYNTSPIGAGPYKINKVNSTASGIPVSYQLKAHEEYTLGTPYIRSILIRFYANADDMAQAWRIHAIDAMSTTSSEILAEQGDAQILHATLPRVFAVFFNQNKSHVFADAIVREALSVSVDREAIIRDVLNGYGTPIYSPLPLVAPAKEEEDEDAEEKVDRLTQARTLLEDDGWERNEETGVYQKKEVDLAFTITVPNIPEIKTAANLVRAQWETLGARVDVAVFESSDFNQNVLRPRDYEAVLFGEVIGREPDLFAFWHSSQRNDPGLNIALYANSTVDKALAEARRTTDTERRKELNQEAATIIADELPAVFLYMPDYLYAMNAPIRGIHLTTLATPSERFGDVFNWHVYTERVLPFFNK